VTESGIERWVEESASLEEAFALLAELVAIPSYPGDERAVQERIVRWFAAMGLAAELLFVTPERPNVVLRIENGAGPTLLLNGHVDTVLADPAWAFDPWQGRREGDVFRGLGACDMKAGVVAAMLATRALAQHRDLWRGTLLFTSVVDEEAYSIGANALIADGLAADYCVVTEASWDAPCLGSFGKYLVRCEVIGRAAHASWPERGINAAEEAARFVATLGSMSLPTHPSIRASQTVLSFLAGSPQYVITLPESAIVLINRHTVPGEAEESVLAAYQALAADLDSPATFRFSIDPPRYPSWQTDADHPLVRRFATAYAAETGHEPTFAYTGYGDPNLFSTIAGISTVMFGPKGGGYHSSDEWVDLPSIPATTRVLLRLACDLLPA
jgi:succinyl-diaminopimelate desuccinylase